MLRLFWGLVADLPAFPTLAGRDGLASDCQHSHAIAVTQALRRTDDRPDQSPALALVQSAVFTAKQRGVTL